MTPAPPFTFRRCLWLCLPALLIGAVLRISFLLAVPEGYYGGDSNSYFLTAREFYLDHRFDLPPKRRYIYPFLLVAAPPVPFCNTVQIVALVQHAVGLATIVGIGWITGHLVRRPALWVPAVTIFTAMWPRMLYYEHEIICESLLLAAFVATAAIAVPPGGLASDRRLIWFCLGALLIVAIKPAGRPLWLGLMIAAALITRRPFSWPKACYATFPFVVLISLTSGGDSQGPWLFLSSTLPLVKTEGAPYPAERALLRPLIEEARADLANYAFRQGAYKKTLANTRPDNPLGPHYVKFASDRQRFNKAAWALAVNAVLSDPFRYLRMVGMKIIAAAADRHNELRIEPHSFWKEQNASNDERWDKRPGEMRLVYEMDQPAYDAMVAERSQRPLWFGKYLRPYWTVNWISGAAGDVGGRPQIQMLPMGWLALFGLAMALLPGRFTRTSLLWLPLLLYLGIVFAVGDAVTRYLVPVDWTAFILIAIGLDTALDGLSALWARFRNRTLEPDAHPKTSAPLNSNLNLNLNPNPSAGE